MASRFEKGKPIFFLFRNRYTVQDSQLKPRYYLTKNKAKEYAVCDNDEVVEYAPVVHGRWVEKDDNWYETYYDCSVCGDSWVPIDGTPEQNNVKYCPNCGAKMDGGVDNEKVLN